MKFKKLGNTDLKVSLICLGTMTWGKQNNQKEAFEQMDYAVSQGINFFDTAEMYAVPCTKETFGKTEIIIGNWFKEKKNREKIILATKVSGPGLSWIRGGDLQYTKRNITSAIEGSLKRLRTDYIDLYQLHRPSSIVPIEETLDVLTDLIKQGKIRYIGCSTHPAWKVAESIRISEKKHFSKIVTEQSPYNLLDRRIENELIPMCEYYGLGLITWAPLAMGVLAGRYKKNEQTPKNSRAILRGGFYADRVNERGIEAGLKLNKIAENLGLTSAQLAVLWVKHQKGVTAPLIGPRTIKQLKEFIKIIDKSIDESVCELCDQIVPPGSAVADFYNTAPWMKMKI